MARVEVAYSAAPREVDLVQLEVSDGATVLHALRESRLLERHPDIDLATAKVGVWGRVAPLSQVLREGDRVEVYRPLIVDPKEARRLRYKRHRGASGNSTR
jgi:putative ubiquitin-RnfH superfamily antitoxin RatB of RatAB toxin-antitoxin module